MTDDEKEGRPRVKLGEMGEYGSERGAWTRLDVISSRQKSIVAVVEAGNTV